MDEQRLGKQLEHLGTLIYVPYEFLSMLSTPKKKICLFTWAIHPRNPGVGDVMVTAKEETHVPCHVFWDGSEFCVD